MTLFPVSPESQAYIDGRKAAQSDVLLGRVSEYAWYGEHDSNWYVRNYAIGYREVIYAAQRAEYDRRRRA